MRKHKLTSPELLFIVGTRILFAVGVSLLLSDRLSKRARKIAGGVLLGIGIITTPPALMKVLGKS